MRLFILHVTCCVISVVISISANAQSFDFNAPDPLSTLSEAQMQVVIKEYGKSVVYAAQSDDIAYLRLDPYTSLELGKFKSEYNRNVRALKQSTKSGAEYRELMKQYNERLRSQIIALVGKEKCEQREYFMEMLPERKYMKEYGFSEGQIAAYSHKAFKETQMEEIRQLDLSPEIALMMGELVAGYKSDFKKVADVAYTNQGRRLAYKALQESHENHVRTLIGDDKYLIWKKYVDEAPKRKYLSRHGLTESQVSQFSLDAFVWAGFKEIQSLQLSPLDALRMGELKSTYLKSVESTPLNQDGVWDKRREVTNKYRQSVKGLLGQEKFMRWLEFPAENLESLYLQEYGFTNEQYQQYQELENKQAVSIFRIKNSPIPHAEKQERIDRVKEEKIEELRKILPAEQFTRWHRAYLESEALNNRGDL